MGTPELIQNRYVLRSYTQKDLLETATDSVWITVTDSETGAEVIFHDRGAEGLDSVRVNGQDVSDLGAWRSLYHGLRDQVRNSIPQRIHTAFREAKNISLYQQWDERKREWQSQIRSIGNDPTALHTTLGRASADRLAPFSLAEVTITQSSPALYIHITQDASLPWLATTTRYLGLDRVFTAATSFGRPTEKQDLNLKLQPALYRLLPATKDEHATIFQTELGLAIDGIIELSKDGQPFLSLPETQSDPAEAPLPSYRTIAIPTTCPPQLRSRIDPNGDGMVSHINEAWRIYRLATTPAAWDPLSMATLQHLAAQMTRVAPDLSSIQIGASTIGVQRPATNTCAAIPRLFAVGEALRSFGAPLVRQWAGGIAGEPALTILPLVPSTVSDRALRTTLWGVAAALRPNVTAFYAPGLNVLVSGCVSTVSGQYWLARHEAGHVLDDYLIPSDDRDGPAIYSDQANNLVEQARSDAFLQALPAAHYRNPNEWISFLMEFPDRWQLAPLALRTLIACAVNATSLSQCTDSQPEALPAETDGMRKR